jgi:hypothetical protein
MVRTKDRVNSVSVNKAANDFQSRFEYDANDNCIYAGTAPWGAAAGEDVWVIAKYTWASGTNGYVCTLKQTAFDSWSNRALATYA